MIRKKSLIFKIMVWVILSTQVFGSAYLHMTDSSEKNVGDLSKIEKEFYLAANKLLDDEKFDKVIESADRYIKNGPDSAIYHLFKGLALVLKYADSVLTKIPFVSKLKESNITEAVKEFEIARTLDPENEDKALSAIVLAYVVSDNREKAKAIFEPAIKKYPGSVHLKYVGIKYYEQMGKKSKSLACKNFVAKNNPQYNGKPVFGGVALVISIGTLAKILTTAIIISYIAGFKTGMKIEL